MRTLASGLIAGVLAATLAMPAAAAPRDRDRAKAQSYKGYGYTSPNIRTGDCVVTGWTDWSLTKPIFKCPGDEQPAGNLRRR